MASVRVHLLVTGRVQGVFFRQGTSEQAARLKLSGWVQNLPDGSVEIEAEGPEEGVRALVSWAQRGPPRAQVCAVEERWVSPTGSERDFSVRR